MPNFQRFVGFHFFNDSLKLFKEGALFLVSAITKTFTEVFENGSNDGIVTMISLVISGDDHWMFLNILFACAFIVLRWKETDPYIIG